VMVNPGEPQMVSAGYGGGLENASVPPEAADVGVVDARTGVVVAASLHMGGEGMDARRFQPGACLLPRAAAVDTARGALLVACLGSDKVIEYDAASDNPGALERRHFDVASGPTGIAIDSANARAVVWSEFARTLDVLDLGKSGGVAHVALGKGASGADEDTLSLGRALFHKVGDARVAADGRACASCHPDGRDDGIVWSSPDGPRQTPMLAGRLTKTAPYGWTGSGESVAAHVRETFARLHGKGLGADDLDALLRYVTTMAPPSSAAKKDADHVARIDRGRHIFKSGDAACATCHAVDGSFTDGQRHDVVSATSADRARAFDTPSLRFVGGTAPYFHDGRYATLHDLLVATDGKMGHTAHLSPADLDALEAYLATL
jgi:mono/diheme cytochrome c family protein